MIVDHWGCIREPAEEAEYKDVIECRCLLVIVVMYEILVNLCVHSLLIPRPSADSMLVRWGTLVLPYCTSARHYVAYWSSTEVRMHVDPRFVRRYVCTGYS